MNVCRIFLWFIYICILVENPIIKDHIGGLMVSVRTMNAVYTNVLECVCVCEIDYSSYCILCVSMDLQYTDLSLASLQTSYLGCVLRIVI
jgi:hypothetical protein